MLQKPEISAGLMGYLAQMQTLPFLFGRSKKNDAKTKQTKKIGVKRAWECKKMLTPCTKPDSPL